ncbi:MAG: hypothetical protein V3S69_01975 [Dehalococcoidales bacterium]
MGKPIVIVLVLFLGGCAYVPTVIGAKQAYNDTKAKALTVAVCDMSIGAYFRLPPMQRRAVEALCGGESMPRRKIRIGRALRVIALAP